MAQLQRCEVVWLDAHRASDDTWHDLEHPLEQAACQVVTRGFLMPHAKPNHVTIAGTLSSDGMVSDITCIPNGMVLVIETE